MLVIFLLLNTPHQVVQIEMILSPQFVQIVDHFVHIVRFDHRVEFQVVQRDECVNRRFAQELQEQSETKIVLHLSVIETCIQMRTVHDEHVVRVDGFILQEACALSAKQTLVYKVHH